MGLKTGVALDCNVGFRKSIFYLNGCHFALHFVVLLFLRYINSSISL